MTAQAGAVLQVCAGVSLVMFAIWYRSRLRLAGLPVDAAFRVTYIGGSILILFAAARLHT